jgi:hypoxanthine phosphoribosyltransferase
MLVNPNQYWQDAEIIHTELAVNQAISAIAKQLNADYANDTPLLICVMTGGLYLTGQLLPKLTFNIQLDYVQATRYAGELAGPLKWIKTLDSNVNNRNVLIVDDILDEGVTLKAIVDACMQHGANIVKTVVLVEKALNQAKPIQADYIGLHVPNRYVFGCGMDINGWHRNLPAIYALKNS